MSREGIVMRLAQLQPDRAITDSAWAPNNAMPGVAAVYKLISNDNEVPQYAAFYLVADISKITNDRSLYAADVQKHSEDFVSLAWVVVSFVNGRNPGETSPYLGTQKPSSPPSPGTIVVANGSTPRPEWESDYHAWYDQEHGGKLAKVPGWQLMRRYKLEMVFGDAATANFYGINFYDEKNGLGGPEWKAGVTDWTLRIRDQAAKPNVRRVWKLVETQ